MTRRICAPWGALRDIPRKNLEATHAVGSADDVIDYVTWHLPGARWRVGVEIDDDVLFLIPNPDPLDQELRVDQIDQIGHYEGRWYRLYSRWDDRGKLEVIINSLDISEE